MKKANNFFKKHPVLVILALYCILLNLLLVQKPEWGDAFFGWQKREALLLEAIDDSDEYIGKIVSLSPGRYGMTAVVKASLLSLTTVRLMVYLPKDTPLLVGDTVCLKGKASLPSIATNPGQFDQKSYARVHKIDMYLRPTEAECLERQSNRSVFYWLWCSRDAVNAKIRTIYKSPYSGVIAAMLTGDRSILEEEEEELFSQAGISHIIAISGLHLSVLISVLERKNKKGMTSRRKRRIIEGVIWLYALWTGGSVATLRSALMVSIRYEAPFVSRKPDPINTMASAVLLQLLFQPILWKSAAFWLSYGTLIGLKIGTVFFLRIRRSMKQLILPMPVYKKLSPYFGILLVTYPLMRWFFDHASVFSFLINLWVIPCMQLLIPFAILSVGLSFIGPAWGAGFASLCQLLLKSFEWGSRIIVNMEEKLIPSALVWGKPEIYQIVLYYGILLALFFLLSKKDTETTITTQRIILTGVFILMSLYLILPSHRWRVTFLDVGQGDAAVIEWEGKVILIDAGPSYKKVILPYLEMRGITSIDLAILSHPDKDHTEGLSLLAKDGKIPVKTLLLADQQAQETPERQALEQLLQEAGTDIQKVKAGEQRSFWSFGKELTVDVVFPDKEYDSTNASSLTVLVRFFGNTFLFTGDIEAAGEQTITELYPEELFQDCIVKAAHHGSDTSSSEPFLVLTKPSLYVISCGRNNSYGHPSKHVLSRLEENHIPYRITARNGAVYLQGFGRKRHYYTFLKDGAFQ